MNNFIHKIIRNIAVFVFIAVFFFYSALSASAIEMVSDKTDETQDVQQEQANDTVRFVDNVDGTVLDRNSGLMWLKNAYYSKRILSWEGSEKYIQDMNNEKLPNFGYKNWRVPTIHDFETLIDKTAFYPALPEGHPFENVQNNFYWTSSKGTDITDFIWIVDIASGNRIFDYVSHCNYRYLWPVRSSWSSPISITGTVLSSGLNEYGQLGNGTTENRRSFLPVENLYGVIKISAGMGHAVALSSDGTLWTWGRNREGQLGIGASGNSLVPKLVKGLGTVGSSRRCRRHVPHSSTKGRWHCLGLGKEHLRSAR
jgi:hypothetical protein